MGVAKNVLTRLARLLAVVLIVSFLTFSLTKLLPGDPVNVLLGPQASNQEVRAAVEKDLGLDKPFFSQYASYVSGALQGDLGRSYTSRFETTTLLGQKLPATIELMLLAQVLSLLISIPLAMYSAYRANSRADKAITATALAKLVDDEKLRWDDHVRKHVPWFKLHDPLADRDLLEFALNVPEHLYRRDGVPRWFMRAVLADRVPAEILSDYRLGAQGTNWFSALNARRGEIAQEVERMETSLAASRLFDIPRLKRLIDNWPKTAADAEAQRSAYMFTLDQAVHVFRFMRWVERGKKSHRRNARLRCPAPARGEADGGDERSRAAANARRHHARAVGGPAGRVRKAVADARQARSIRRRDLGRGRPAGQGQHEDLPGTGRRGLPRPAQEARCTGEPEGGAATQRQRDGRGGAAPPWREEARQQGAQEAPLTAGKEKTPA